LVFMITFKTSMLHWNYFLAIEKDLENLSRYIEFDETNLKTYSIELTHILFSSSSEVDVVMKQLCNLIDPDTKAENINDYRNIISKHSNELINEEVVIHRYGLTFRPWLNWQNDKNPDWWQSYNHVKHERNKHYSEANLKNAINAVGALLLTVVYYYKYAFSQDYGVEIKFRDTIQRLVPESSFMKINNIDYYYSPLFSEEYEGDTTDYREIQ
jgi:hypothetical protein